MSKVVFPPQVLQPMARFLRQSLQRMQQHQKKISNEDPFKDPDRVNDNAAPDTEADEQFGHARVRAMQKVPNRQIVQTKKALTRIRLGKYGLCLRCQKMIDTDRLMVYPQAEYCASCQKLVEKK